MEEPKDKRTKKYKEYVKFNKLSNDDKLKLTQDTLKSASDMIDWDKVNNNSIGLGDTIEKVLKKTGVKKLVELFTDGEDCGCDKRKEKLNTRFPYKRRPRRCFNEQQYNQYKLYRKSRTLNVWGESDIHLLIKLYAHIFAIQYKANDLCRNCAGSGKILFKISKELDIVYETYKRDLMDLKIK